MAVDGNDLEEATAYQVLPRSPIPQTHFTAWTENIRHDRLVHLRKTSASAGLQVDGLIDLALTGLSRMHKAGSFAHTLRRVKTKPASAAAPGERLEGESLRYTAMAALGLSRVSEGLQRQVLGSLTAADLARLAARRAESSTDIGAVALAAWASAEVGHVYATRLFRRLAEDLASDAPMPTVACAWALVAGLAGRRLGETSEVIVLARNKLVQARSAVGLFPHQIPAAASGRMRSHIGSFADQVYPIQALARFHAAFGDRSLLSMAEQCAKHLCGLQGRDGQWWWHYDIRDGAVAEGYPVYSVHQHAMAPMILLELREAGGSDYLPAIIKGLRWLNERPEVAVPLVIPEKGVVWRKVARREPNKASRAIAAFTTAISPGLHMPGLDTLFPPRRVDYECRPYELGWLLYAWLSGGAVAELANDGH